MSICQLFALSFDAVTLQQAAEQVVAAAEDKLKGLVVTPNVDHVVLIDEDPEMASIYQKALFRYADGMPIVWTSRLLRGCATLPERVTGADLLPAVCSLAATKGLRVFFLGGKEGVALKASQNMERQFPGLITAGIYSPPFGFEHSERETTKAINAVNNAAADILFIGVGTPKQEKWTFKNLDRLEVGPVLCIGASLDFAAGLIERAPRIVQSMGLEWLWRLVHEPRRLWRRYILRDSKFLLHVVTELRKTRR